MHRLDFGSVSQPPSQLVSCDKTADRCVVEQRLEISFVDIEVHVRLSQAPFPSAERAPEDRFSVASRLAETSEMISKRLKRRLVAAARGRKVIAPANLKEVVPRSEVDLLTARVASPRDARPDVGPYLMSNELGRRHVSRASHNLMLELRHLKVVRLPEGGSRVPDDSLASQLALEPSQDLLLMAGASEPEVWTVPKPPLPRLRCVKELRTFELQENADGKGRTATQVGWKPSRTASPQVWR